MTFDTRGVSVLGESQSLAATVVGTIRFVFSTRPSLLLQRCADVCSFLSSIADNHPKLECLSKNLEFLEGCRKSWFLEPCTVSLVREMNQITKTFEYEAEASIHSALRYIFSEHFYVVYFKI